jgi:mono/diheme cytochrome c family protein
MPAWKNVLSQREIGAIADYVSRAFHPLPDLPPNPPGQRP